MNGPRREKRSPKKRKPLGSEKDRPVDLLFPVPRPGIKVRNPAKKNRNAHLFADETTR